VPIIGGKEYPTASQIVFHPDPNIFPEPAGAGHALSVEQALRSIHLGTHTLQTNEGIRIDKNPNFPFMTIQETQGSGTTQNMLTGLEVKDLGADVRFAGGDENEVIIHTKCDDKTLIGGTDDYNVYVLAFLIGAISKGATTKTYTR